MILETASEQPSGHSDITALEDNDAVSRLPEDLIRCRRSLLGRLQSASIYIADLQFNGSTNRGDLDQILFHQFSRVPSPRPHSPIQPCHR